LEARPLALPSIPSGSSHYVFFSFLVSFSNNVFGSFFFFFFQLS